MKVSQEKKKEIRRDLLKAAVEIMTKKGFSRATMREISEKAGYGTATIYNYFPNKEKILFGYFEEKQHDVTEILGSIPEFDDFSLKEKMQAQLESLLDLYLHDREFVQIAYKIIFNSPVKGLTELKSVRDKVISQLKEFVSSAVEKEEIPDLTLGDFILNLYWDYTGLVVLYWLHDDSEGFTNTSRFIDMSLDITVTVLSSGIIPRVFDMLGFLVRTHIYNSFEGIKKYMQSGADIRETLDRLMRDDK